MNFKKILLITTLTIFIIGMCISGVNATKNSDGTADIKINTKGADINMPPAKVKYNDATIHLTKNEVNKIEKGNTIKKTTSLFKVQIKTRKKVKVAYKKPVYGYKKVKKTRWVTVKVCDADSYSYCTDYSYSSTTERHDITKYYNNYKKYKWCGNSYEIVASNPSYEHVKYYTHFKYKESYTAKVKYVKYYKKAYKYDYVYTTSKKWTPVKLNCEIYKGECNKYILSILNINNCDDNYIIILNTNYKKTDSFMYCGYYYNFIN